MPGRKTVNQTGITRVEGVPYHDAWVAYKCVNCQNMNYENVGQNLLKPKEAVEGRTRKNRASALPGKSYVKGWPLAGTDTVWSVE